MGFAYRFLLTLLYPTSLCLTLLLASAALRKRKKVSRSCFWAGIGILLICGNGWIARGLTRNLEWQYLPPQPVPSADCILVLSGGIGGQVAPRPTIEVGDAGDRVLYGAHLFRNGKAPRILCTGGVSPGGVRPRPEAEDMMQLLEMIGVPEDAIIKETKSSNTREHARNLYPLFLDRGFKRVLLVTSAMHMPRSIGVFRKLCPDIEFIPAPTDFHVTEGIPMPWYRDLITLIPTAGNLVSFSNAAHEYVGMAYYKMRGWM